MKIKEIETINLIGVLPAVFAAENPDFFRASEIWLTETTFRRGERYLVAADSGTGKSSLCSFIYGARRDYSGRIDFNGVDSLTLKGDDWAALRCRSLAYLPQEMGLFPELTVMENIVLKNNLTGFRDATWIENALAELEIADKANQTARFLSVGQQQRVAIIRALCQPFDFILLDEPVSHLDSRRAQIAARLIEREASEMGASIIATTVGNDLPLSSSIIKKL